MLAFVGVCAACLSLSGARAQPPTSDAAAHDAASATEAPNASTHEDPPADADDRDLEALESAVSYARFQEAHRLAAALLARTALSARQRNETLELLAIAQIAARQDEAAQATLRDLLARDPEHRPRLRDPGPSVEAAFARIRREPRRALALALTSTIGRDALGRALATVQLGPGRDAVASVHVFARPGRDIEPTHLVAEVGAREALAVALPTPLAGDARLELYVEARAPSGSVIGREGSWEAPLVTRLPAPVCPAPSTSLPLRRKWWVWTSAAIAVAGLGVAGALAAH